MRHAHEGDWAGAIAAFDRDRQINGLGVDTRGDRIDHLSTLIADHGVEPTAWYGVRLFTDGWTPDRPDSDPEELVLHAELMASQRDPIPPTQPTVPSGRPPPIELTRGRCPQTPGQRRVRQCFDRLPGAPRTGDRTQLHANRAALTNRVAERTTSTEASGKER